MTKKLAPKAGAKCEKKCQKIKIMNKFLLFCKKTFTIFATTTKITPLLSRQIQTVNSPDLQVTENYSFTSKIFINKIF